MIKKIIFSFFICIILVSCKYTEEISNTFQNLRTRQLDILYDEESLLIRQMSNDIIRIFEEKDKEALKLLFCEQIRNTHTFNEEIEKAFEFLDFLQYSTFTTDSTSSGGLRESGQWVERYLTPRITYLKVLVGSTENLNAQYYSILYFWQITNENDKTLEGLHYMEIELLNVSKVYIGENPNWRKD